MRPVYVIAEAGVNHDGSEEKAVSLIDIAASAGADAVKFQLFDPKALVTEKAPTADYQAKNLNDRGVTQRDMLEKLTLPKEAYARLERHCKKQKIDFICTPFEEESLAYLTTHTQMPCLKLPSGEVTNGPFLLAAARSGLPIILSTGMSDLEEIGTALAVIHFGLTHKSGHPGQLGFSPDMIPMLQDKVTLLHCVSQYPAPAEATNLRAMQTMKDAFGLPVGLSDHSLGIDVALAAASLGAVMIEKHFSYDTKARGPDHAASLDEAGLKALIAGIREGKPHPPQPSWLGDGIKRCQPIEENTRLVARKSLVSRRLIKKGEMFSEAHLACKRPGDGPLAPNALWELLGKPAKRDYAADDFIAADEVK